MRPALRHSLRLSQALRKLIAERLLTIRLELVSQIHGVVYTPDLSCPNCNHEVGLVDILKGYSADPTDLHTTCPICEKKFVAQIRSGPVELVWYCPMQTIEALRGFVRKSPVQILTANPSLYHSAVTHFGGVANAFREGDMEYEYEEKVLWHERVIPFLGKMTDAMIAEVVGVSAGTISRLRKKLGISRFNRSELVDSIV
jgi:hypothetical protein